MTNNTVKIQGLCYGEKDIKEILDNSFKLFLKKNLAIQGKKDV